MTCQRLLRRVLLCGSFCFMLFSVLHCIAPWLHGPSLFGPVLKVEEPEWNCGGVRIGEKVAHTFRITNSGWSVGNVEKIIPGCDCTAVSSLPNGIPPGCVADISVTMPIAIKGPIRHEVLLITNDRSQPRIVLSLIGSGLRDIEVIPPQIVLAHSDTADVTPSATIIVESHSRDFDVRRAFSNDDFLSVTKEVVEVGRVYRVRVSLGSPMPAGRSTGVVVLRTNHPREATLRIPVTVEYESAVKANKQAATGSDAMQLDGTNTVNRPQARNLYSQ